MSTVAQEYKAKKLDRKGNKFSTKSFTRCQSCGRSRAVFRKFKLCRICLRKQFHIGNIPGYRKGVFK